MIYNDTINLHTPITQTDEYNKIAPDHKVEFALIYNGQYMNKNICRLFFISGMHVLFVIILHIISFYIANQYAHEYFKSSICGMGLINLLTIMILIYGYISPMLPNGIYEITYQKFSNIIAEISIQNKLTQHKTFNIPFITEIYNLFYLSSVHKHNEIYNLYDIYKSYLNMNRHKYLVYMISFLLITILDILCLYYLTIKRDDKELQILLKLLNIVIKQSQTTENQQSKLNNKKELKEEEKQEIIKQAKKQIKYFWYKINIIVTICIYCLLYGIQIYNTAINKIVNIEDKIL